jgi:hypothetical protein
MAMGADGTNAKLMTRHRWLGRPSFKTVIALALDGQTYVPRSRFAMVRNRTLRIWGSWRCRRATGEVEEWKMCFVVGYKYEGVAAGFGIQ